jgi:hypothetical protein
MAAKPPPPTPHFQVGDIVQFIGYLQGYRRILAVYPPNPAGGWVEQLWRYDVENLTRRLDGTYARAGDVPEEYLQQKQPESCYTLVHRRTDDDPNGW